MSEATKANGYVKTNPATLANGVPMAYHDLSSKHAEWALRSLSEASRMDPRDQHPKTVAAHTYAVLSHRDKVDEMVTVARDIRDILADIRDLMADKREVTPPLDNPTTTT